jgi:hypothetical protein
MAKKFLTDIDIAGGIYDSSGDIGNSGQVLSSTGSGLNWIDSTASSSVIYQDAFSGNGSATAFTLANSVDDENKTQVYVDGVYQFKNTYSISGTTLTFSTAPPNNTNIEVISFNSITGDGDILTDSEFGSAGLMTTNGSGVYSITTNNSSNWNTAYTYSQVGHLPLAGGAITGAITTNSTFDGRDVSVDGTKLDGIETGATADQTAAEIRVLVEAATDSNVFTDADHTKLNAIEASADVTDTVNVTAAGALMDSELTDLAGIKAVTISDLATETYVDTAVSDLVDSSPATLNTLNELAAALGDDPNFATTTANSIGTKMPLAGGTFTGNISIPDKLIHSGDTNTYLSFSGADNIKLVAGGKNVLHAHDNGNLYLYGNNGTALTLDGSQNATFAGEVNAGDRIKTEAATSNALLQVKYNSSNYLEAYYDKLNVVGGDFLLQRGGDTKINLTAVGTTFTNLSNTSAASSSVDEIKIGTFGAGRPAIFFGSSNTTYTNSTWFIENIGAAGKLRIGRNGLDIVEIFNNGSTTFAGHVSATEFRPTNIVTNKVVKFNGTQLDDSIITDDGSTVTVAGDVNTSGDITISSTSPELKFVDTNSFTDANDRWIVRGGANTLIMRWFDWSLGTNTDVLTLSSTAATFAGDVNISSPGDLYINSGTSYNNIGSIFLSNQRTEINSIIVDGTAQGDTAINFKTRSAGSTASAMFIDEFRNVGIGATSLDAKLHLQQDQTSESNVIFMNNSTGANAAMRLSLNVGNPAGNDPKISFNIGDGGLDWTMGVDNSDSDKFKISGGTDSHNTNLGTNDRLVIDSSGNVGISVTSPGAQLDVVGPSNGSAILKLQRNGVGAYQYFVTDIGSGSQQLFCDAQQADSGFVFRTRDSGNATIPALYIAPSGNIGIGNTSPDEKLEISGTGSVYPNIKFSFPGVTSRYMRIGMVSAVKYEFEVNGADTYMVFKTEGVERMQINSTYVKIAAGKQLRIGDYFHLGSGTSSYMGTIGFNRDTSNGDIFNSSYGAYQIHNFQGELKLQVYSSAGGTIGEHKFFNNGKVSFFNNVAIGLTSSPTTRLEVRGALSIGPAIADNNIAYSSTNFSHQDGGALHVNYSLGGSTSSGDTITFTYAATTWKSWSLKYNFASTSGITQGVVGGYWNNSGGSSNHIDHNNHGVSVAVTHTGQGNTVTFTFTNLGTHPMGHFVYMQGGGDGQPRADRVTLNGVT